MVSTVKIDAESNILRTLSGAIGTFHIQSITKALLKINVKNIAYFS